MNESPSPEFSRPVELTGGVPIGFRIDAGRRERAALAARFGLVGLDRLDADGTLVRHGDGSWALEATLRADVVRTCVVTLEPFAQALSERFAVVYAPDARARRPEIDLAADDAEPLPSDGRLDVGEAVAQQLALALDPFPRRPGAELPATATEPAAGPFAVLARRPGREPGGGPA